MRSEFTKIHCVYLDEDGSFKFSHSKTMSVDVLPKEDQERIKNHKPTDWRLPTKEDIARL